jgi:hypothetical protein
MVDASDLNEIKLKEWRKLYDEKLATLRSDANVTAYRQPFSVSETC